MRGRVLRQAEDWVKIKPFETHDLPITGFQKGRASIAAKLGFVTTTRALSAQASLILSARSSGLKLNQDYWLVRPSKSPACI